MRTISRAVFAIALLVVIAAAGFAATAGNDPAKQPPTTLATPEAGPGQVLLLEEEGVCAVAPADAAGLTTGLGGPTLNACLNCKSDRTCRISCCYGGYCSPTGRCICPY